MDNNKNGDGAEATEASEQVIEHCEPSLQRSSEAFRCSDIPVVADGEAVPEILVLLSVVAAGEAVSKIPVPAKGEPNLDLLVGGDAPFADVNWRYISCNDPEPGKPSIESPDCPVEEDESRESDVPPRASPISAGASIVPPRSRRKPCYGWISETESESEEEEVPSI